ncbi:MAG: AmmeMemoRadiSam system radical SAM enzyme [Deltaproteobacteria bacterium]|jgi:pyruvate formate lyase activating enzyme|nr:AmmeMemoRadiSam system radical SAM enzyme [Deltaproteobacteria bacterium]
MPDIAKNMFPARFWEAADEQKVVCSACFRRCVVKPGRRGFCQCRTNSGGKLFTLNYGDTRSVSADPVEKKPLYHFRPGTMTFSIGTPGCNLTCLGCQNSHLSQPGADWPGVEQKEGTVEDLVRLSLRHQADTWSFTYSEPTIFYEYACDLAQKALEHGLESIWVTNGSMTPELLKTLPPAVAAMNIDLKGFTEEFYQKITGGSLRAVLDNIELALSLGLWVEATTLLIPGLNDSPAELKNLASFLAGLSPDMPWHVSRFFPRHRQNDVPATPERSLRLARDIGRESGLRHVYVGNVSGPGFSDTLCPGCGETLVVRDGFRVSLDRLSGSGKCPECGTAVAGRWSRGAARV